MEWKTKKQEKTGMHTLCPPPLRFWGGVGGCEKKFADFENFIFAESRKPVMISGSDYKSLAKRGEISPQSR